MKLEKIGIFNKKDYTFLTHSGTLFENLYNNNKDKIIRDENNNELINENNCIYYFKNPHKIKISFLDGTQKDIFFANINQLYMINIDIQNNIKENFRIEIKDKNNKYVKSMNISQCYESNDIKYVNDIIDEDDFDLATKYKKINEGLTLQDLSLNYQYYLEDSNFIDNKINYFSNTEERKNFFEFLNKELKNQTLLAICGLEGIGKTASILAYLKYYETSYFYFNIKTINKLLEKKDKNQIINILQREMYHFIPKLELAENFNKKIISILNNYDNAMDILYQIIYIIKNCVSVVVIDQYKTKYDNQYKILKNIIDSNRSSKMIIVSSMNEDDIRKSIIISIKGKIDNIKEKPVLDYYYIIKLVEVSEEDINELSEPKKKLLKEFGNLYIYYYKIKELKNYKNQPQKFKDSMEEEIDKKVNEYFINKDFQQLYTIFKYLIFNENKEMCLEDCLKYIENIPLRFFFLKYNNENIIKFSDLKKDSKISFCVAFDYIREFFLYSFNKLFTKMNKQGNSKSFQDPLALEIIFGIYLWGSRNNIELNNLRMNFVDIFKVNSIIDIKDEYATSLGEKIKKLKKKESILLFQINKDARMFDFAILMKISDENYELYVIQVTNKKESSERLTITSLNDNINYLNGYLCKQLKIKIINNYFIYVFNKLNPDTASISYCEQNNIDYLLFDSDTLTISNNSSLNPLNYYLPAFKFDKQTNNKERMITIPKLLFSEDTLTEDNLKNTENFLQKKRELLRKDDLKEFIDLSSYEKKLLDTKKNISNYERKEFIVDNYLLSNQFKNQKIYGVSYIKTEITDLDFNEIQLANLFKYCGKSIDNDIIFKINNMPNFNLNTYLPEYDNFVIFCSRKKEKFFIDFINKCYYDLDENSEEKSKKNIIIDFGKFYSIMFLNKNIFISENNK